jgi:multidrug efflux system membrane fusion protein
VEPEPKRQRKYIRYFPNNNCKGTKEMSSFFIGNLKFKVNNWIRFNCIAAALLFSMTILINGCSKKEQIQARPPAPVKTAIAINKDIPVQIEENGTVEAYSTVNITSRVDGHLIEVHVNEGQNVEKGQLLFSLDDRPYKAVLQSAQSNLIRDKIKFEKAQKDAARYTDLIEKDYVTRTMYEQAVADAKSLEAVVKGDEAALENARLNVGYCQITSPISGRAGAVLVNKGNLVKANENKPLIVINQVNPAYVKFAVPEQLLPDIQAQLSAREIEVLAKIPEKSQIIKQGKLTFVDNSVDVKTGTIVLKAMFKNDDHTLWPGQFHNQFR